jgi:twitching motility protein PilT
VINLRELLEKMIQLKASDLHLTAGLSPQFRVDGAIGGSDYAVLTPDECTRLAYSVLNEEQKRRFENDRELDLSFGVSGLSRFRCNIFLQRGVVTMAVRQIPYQILGYKQLGVPQVVADLAMRPKGMVLVTGPTGSGKSTTLARGALTSSPSRIPSNTCTSTSAASSTSGKCAPTPTASRRP